MHQAAFQRVPRSRPSTHRAASTIYSMAEGSTGGGEWDLVEEYEVYERACGAMGELLLLVSEV